MLKQHCLITVESMSSVMLQGHLFEVKMALFYSTLPARFIGSLEASKQLAVNGAILFLLCDLLLRLAYYFAGI